MGRWSYSNRDVVEDCKTIDIPWLSRHGYLPGFKTGGITWNNGFSGAKSSIGIEVSANRERYRGNHLRLIYTQTDFYTKEKTDLDYKVELVTTPCNFGGVRYWFICPLTVNGRSCDRRVAKLYMPPGSRYFGCRHCHNLTYRCQKEHNKKVDALLKNPAMMDMVGDMAEAGNLKAALLITKAFFRLEAKDKSGYRL